MSTWAFNPFTRTLDIVGSSSGSTVSFRSRVVPSPLPDNVTTVFTTPDTYIAGSLSVYLNGVFERFISETSTNTFTFQTAPLNIDSVEVSYMMVGTPSSPSLVGANAALSLLGP